MSNILYIVVPCYNEQEVLPETSKRLREKVQTLRQSGKIDADSRILFVNDGSKDATWEMIQKLHEENSVFPVSIYPGTADIRMRFWQGLRWRRNMRI